MMPMIHIWIPVFNATMCENQCAHFGLGVCVRVCGKVYSAVYRNPMSLYQFLNRLWVVSPFSTIYTGGMAYCTVKHNCESLR